jgi:hypothetical protein
MMRVNRQTRVAKILQRRSKGGCVSRVEDRRGGLGHVATLRFPSSLIKPDVPISGIRLSDQLHRKAHGGG